MIEQDSILYHLRQAHNRCDEAMGTEPDGRVKRDLALAKTAIEDASMRASRAATVALGAPVFPEARVRPSPAAF